MRQKDDRPETQARLRSRAEGIAKEQGLPWPENHATLSHDEALKLVHELRVHQVELAMQNQELCAAQAELDATRERYFDLYNLAPVGYFVVSHEGRILEVNLTGANLLGLPRAALVEQPITRFIFKEDQDVYYLHRRDLLATRKAHTCELRMVKTDGVAFWVRLMATMAAPSTSSKHGNGGLPPSRVVLSDISEQKRMEQDKAKLDAQLRLAKQRPRIAPKPARGKNGKCAARK